MYIGIVPVLTARQCEPLYLPIVVIESIAYPTLDLSRPNADMALFDNPTDALDFARGCAGGIAIAARRFDYSIPDYVRSLPAIYRPMIDGSVPRYDVPIS